MQCEVSRDVWPKDTARPPKSVMSRPEAMGRRPTWSPKTKTRRSMPSALATTSSSRTCRCASSRKTRRRTAGCGGTSAGDACCPAGPLARRSQRSLRKEGTSPLHQPACPLAPAAAALAAVRAPCAAKTWASVMPTRCSSGLSLCTSGPETRSTPVGPASSGSVPSRLRKSACPTRVVHDGFAKAATKVESRRMQREHSSAATTHRQSTSKRWAPMSL
mmetsp:Transcript_65528/g.211316  ORF Transcript_65528/g.211316 Transcript_65528/m.211316 type:complete len:218 (-) Transcript_65528:257-910(-)